MFDDNDGILGPMFALGGIALLANMFDDKQKKAVQVNAYVDKRAEAAEARREAEEARRRAEDERRERAHKRQIELQRKKAEAANPNDMEFVNERIDLKINTGIVGFMCFIMYGFAILCLCGGLAGIVFTIIFSIIGTIFLSGWSNMKKEKEKCQKCATLIVNQGYKNMGEIANVMQCTNDEAYNMVSRIIAEGFIKGFCINKNTRKISEMRNETSDSTIENDNISNDVKSHNEKCHSCGGNKFIKINNKLVCKYCGEVIN